jgi:hypothetical protein
MRGTKLRGSLRSLSSTASYFSLHVPRLLSTP